MFFIGQYIPFLPPTFYELPLALPSHLLSSHLTRIYLPCVTSGQALPTAGPTQCSCCCEHFPVPGDRNDFQGHFSRDTDVNLLFNHMHFQMVKQTGVGKVRRLGSARPLVTFLVYPLLELDLLMPWVIRET